MAQTSQNMKPQNVQHDSLSDNTNTVNNEEIWISGKTKSFSHEFTKIKQLGIGKYGITYQCVRKRDDKTFAVKYLNKHKYSCSNINIRNSYIQMLRNEVGILQTVNHDNIIKLVDIYEDEKILYVVMEEGKGDTLFDHIVKKQRYSENDAAKIIKQLLSALRYMHDDKGIVHGDLKPENILFLNKEKDSPIKIIDFGMSKILPRLHHLTDFCGTPYYTAPEIVGKHGYNHSCDIWSIGIILYVMIYGYPPFYVDAQTCQQKERDMIHAKIMQGFEAIIKSTKIYGYGPWFPDHIKTSPELRDLITKLLQTKVKHRYTAKEALIHPWIINRTNSKDINSIIMSRLLRFNNISQFKLVIATIFRSQFVTARPENVQQLIQLFKKFDVNNDGILSFEEFESGFNSLNYLNIDKKHSNAIYKQLTASPIGIKFIDLLNALVYDYLISSDHRLYDAFIKLDQNHDGKIKIMDLKQYLKVIDPLGEWDKAIKLIEQESKDKNGEMQIHEFILKLHPIFEPIPECLLNL